MKPKQCTSLTECKELYSRLDKNLKQKAVTALKKKLQKDNCVETIKKAIKNHSDDWIHHLYDKQIAKLTEHEREIGMEGVFRSQGHFGFGMAVRNWLRQNHFGEDEFKIANLDDIYIYLIEDAVK